MRFSETPIRGVFVIDPEPKVDERGSFSRLWCAREFAEHGLTAAFVQCNASSSVRKGTLRGLHYQIAPHGEVKLVRCTRGAVYDVVVDVRPESPTYLRWHGVELSAANKRMLYVAEGLAHGFLTLEDDCEVTYPVSRFHQPDAERGIRWDDPLFAVDWPKTPSLHVSPKDRAWPDFVPDLARQQP
jgi:dTDP-4-dehydrorhamnose 3,5-epimerase